MSVINNPYMQEFLVARRHPDAVSWEFQHRFTHKYSWSVPTDAALLAIKNFAPAGICEIGAGTGYWAKLLRELGVNVAAYDPNPVEEGGNRYHKNVTSFTTMERGDVTAVSQHSDRVLMLCWPPKGWGEHGSPMSHEALEQFAGDRLVYIGQGRGGVTGTEEFHQLLKRDWTCVKRTRLPHFKHIYNALHLYQRKATNHSN
jgi:hypothetical protein